VIRPPQTLVDDLTTILQWTRGSRAVPYPEIDTINVIIGDGVNPLVAGVAAAIRVDFNSRITGIFLQEFDGTSGSVSIKIEKGAGDNRAGHQWRPILCRRDLGRLGGRVHRP
jgi:hypothetical protein